ncbi:inositol monophosphatase [Patescibacteria group bacterium]|nr:MAG: inositol monophosphatase [Patescibacteria group bacterium]
MLRMTIMTKDLKIAIKIVQKTNKLLAKKFQKFGLDHVKLKKGEEIVTDADFSANKFITAELLKHFPSDDITSEEDRPIDNPGEKMWFIDPLDGTTNFAFGIRLFATCLSRADRDTIDIGVIGIPMDKEIFWSDKGVAYLNKQKIHVAGNNNHGDKEMFLFCGGHSDAAQKHLLKIIERLNTKTTRFRILSSAGIEMSYVACGRAHGCVMSEIHPWDVLPGVLLVRSAGGRVTNFAGQDWQLTDTELIASNSASHERLLKLVE